MLEIRNVSKSYQMGSVTVQALDQVSVTIEAGEFVAIMGPSGSGKSTLMNVLGLLDTADSGEYKIEGRTTKDLSEDEQATLRGRTIGFIFQQFHLLQHLSALDNVVLPQLYARGTMDKPAAQALLEQVGLGDRLSHRPTELSGGQQQRVAIARSMVNQPLLILADEPTGNLDSKSEAEILDYLSHLNQEGVTVVIVTHEEQVGARANRLIRMKDGRVFSDERRLTLAPMPTPVRPPVGARSWTALFTLLRMQLSQAFANLRGHKLRTFLSTLGITIGVASVVAMISIGEGFRRIIDQQMSMLGQNLVLLEVGKAAIGNGENRGQAIEMEIDVVEKLLQNQSGIKRIVPIKFGQAQAKFGSSSDSVRILGVGNEFFDLHRMKALQGYLFDDSVKPDDRIVVIGADVAKELFSGADPIGATLRLNDTEFEVAGVLKSSENMQMYSERDAVLVPIAVAISRILGDRSVDILEIEAESGKKLDGFDDELKATLNSLYDVPESARENAFQVQNIEGMRSELKKVGVAVSLFLGIVASISLLVGGIGIMNIMLVSVTERTREIGLRKAVGARQSAIFLQFLIESKYVCLLGGGLGILLAFLACVGINLATDDFEVTVSLQTMALATGFSLLVGLMSGLYPARRASRLNPIEALRTL